MIGVKWVGWDGSEWNLRSGPVKLAKGGIVGLGHLSSQTFVRETALTDGQRFTGWRANPRTVFLPVVIGQTANEDEWIELDAAWSKTMRPNKEGTLIITAPDGSERSLAMRFVDDGGVAFDRDPTIDRLSAVVYNMVADDPWWIGPPFTKSFSGGSDPVNFFGAETGQGPPFHIGKASTLGGGLVRNPGDVDSWPTYYIDGPATTFSVLLDGSPISSAIEVADNTQLRIETAPNRQVAYLVTGGSLDAAGVRVDGTETNVTKTALAEVQFATIPEGVDANLTIALTGAGRITLAGVPRFFRAWG